MAVDCPADVPLCAEGTCVACLGVDDCPVPVNPCAVATCIQHVCGTKPVAKGTPLADAEQTPNDCRQHVCDGTGVSVIVADDLDLPVSDGNECTIEGCASGAPTSVSAATGTACLLGGQAGGVCAGGVCGQCIPDTKSCTGGTLTECPGGQLKITECPAATPTCSQDTCVAVAHLAAGGRHSCALLSNGHVVCWGDNTRKQLGISQDSNPAKHVEVTGLTDAVAIAAGEDNTCAIRSNGKVVCWGDNLLGQLGGGDKIPGASATPVEVIGVDQATSLAVGYQFACAVAGPNKEVFCWGSNNFLQLGAVVGPKRSSAGKIDLSQTGFKQVAAGHDHACALTSDGDVFCWGNNTLQQVGKIGSNFPLPPVKVPISNVDSIGAGGNHSCAVVNNSVTCWGANSSGQLGIGKTTFQELLSGTQFTSLTDGLVVGGSEFTCVLDVGKVKCTGSNSSFQLGGGTAFEAIAMVNKPIDVVGTSGGSVTPITGVAEIVAGKEHACVLKTSGQVLCWGANTAAQTGSNPASPKVSFAQLVDWSI
jgi:alpha-tubulin suppressor-like RCC1 family protein